MLSVFYAFLVKQHIINTDFSFLVFKNPIFLKKKGIKIFFP